MPFTTQLDAHTPKPSEARTVEKSTAIAINVFKFGPSYYAIKLPVYMGLRGSTKIGSPAFPPLYLR
jgi:hypothetical protein